MAAPGHKGSGADRPKPKRLKRASSALSNIPERQSEEGYVRPDPGLMRVVPDHAGTLGG